MGLQDRFAIVPLHQGIKLAWLAELGVEAVVALFVVDKQLVIVDQLCQHHGQPLPQQSSGIVHYIIDHDHLQLLVQVDVEDAQTILNDGIGVEGKLF